MWKQIEYNGIKTCYEVSDLGQIRNIKTKYILKPILKTNGYYEYCLYINKQKKFFYAHSLVAKAFLKIDKEKLIINHKDGNKLNNNLNNLEYTDFSGNNQHAWLNKLNHPNVLRKVQQFDLNNIFITEYESITQAVKNTGATHIREVCNGKRISSGGYRWKWTEVFTPKDIGKSKAVKQFTLNRQEIAIFESVSEAARATGANRQGISQVCKGKQSQCGGFYWEYC